MNKRTKRKGEKKYLRSKRKSHIRRKSQKSMRRKIMRRKSMRRKSMKRGGLIGATCDKYREDIGKYDKITNIHVNKKKWGQLSDFMVFEVVIYPYYTLNLGKYSHEETINSKGERVRETQGVSRRFWGPAFAKHDATKQLKIEAISVKQISKLKKILLNSNGIDPAARIPQNPRTPFEELNQYDFSIIKWGNEKKCKNLFENVDNFFRKIEKICRQYNGIATGETIARVKGLIDAIVKIGAPANFKYKDSE